MIPGQRQYFAIFFFVYLLFCSSQFAISQPSGNRIAIAGVPTLWINRPSIGGSDINILNNYAYTPILLEGNASQRFLFGFSCDFDHTKCFLGISLVYYNSTGDTIYLEGGELVWSANRDHPVQVNATLQLGRDGNLVLADSDGTLVWSTNTTGKSVSALNLTELGNLMLFDTTNRTIWQSFDHPTDCLLPGQYLVSGQKLTASISTDNSSQGLFSLTILNGHLAAYIDSDPPQYYYYDSYNPDSRYFSFDGHILTALQYTPTSTTQFIKFEHDGHLRVYRMVLENTPLGFNAKEVDEISITNNCSYPVVCGRYSICTIGGRCICPSEGNFFRPFPDWNLDLGCTELTPISCDSSQYHSLVELNNTQYFAFKFIRELTSSIFWLEGKNIEDCKRACLSNCSCKAAVFEMVWDANQKGNCLLLNEVFSLIDSGVGSDSAVFLKVQNQNSSNPPVISHRQKTKPFKVIIGCTLIGIVSILSLCSALLKKRSQKCKAGDFMDLEPILPGILTRFSYNELKIITEDFSRKLGKGGFGSVYEGTLSNGTKIAVKHLDGVGQVKESFLTEVKTVGGIHHINLVKLIGFCAEKSHRLLIYEYMVNGSLDRWIGKENGLAWHKRQMIISDIAKGLAYLHEDCSHKIIHLDIKPQNILLDQYFNAKISDFGLSKLIEKDKSKVVTRMRGTPGYLAPEWLSSVITEKVDVYAFGIVLLEILCGRQNLDWSQDDEEDVHLLSVFSRKAEQEKLMDMVDRNEDMQLHREAVTEMMSLATWCLQGDFTKRPSMSLVVKALEGLVTVETNLDYNFRNVAKVGTGNQQREAAISTKLPSVLSGPR